jgi:prepilin-type processing-associated H-X9-DG protein
MSPDLLGYLLGALEPGEQAEIEAQLMADPALRERLDELRRQLPPHGVAATSDAPRDLAPRTFKFVMDRLGPQPGQFAATSHWRATDIAAAAIIVVAASFLIVPAIYQGRNQAQTRACQANLAHLGEALVTFSQLHDNRFPEVPAHGNEAVAGIYAPRLREGGLIDDRHIVCAAAGGDSSVRIPSLAEVRAARGESLRQLQRTMGGHYGYSLGYVEAGAYHALRNLARPTFALMADSPGAHGGGHNVLFEDGHVQFLVTSQLGSGDDDFYRNDLGYVGAGIGTHDSVIGSSAVAPVVLRGLLDDRE